MKEQLKSHFEELLIGGLFVGLVAVAIYLMRKADAGGDETAFITWAQTQAALLLGSLITLIMKKAGITNGNGKPVPEVNVNQTEEKP